MLFFLKSYSFYSAIISLKPVSYSKEQKFKDMKN